MALLTYNMVNIFHVLGFSLVKNIIFFLPVFEQHGTQKHRQKCAVDLSQEITAENSIHQVVIRKLLGKHWSS